MSKIISTTKRAYLAGFLDGDGSIYTRLKSNPKYRYGFQISSYVASSQSNKEKEDFSKICSMMNCGYMRERNDDILEYIINRKNEIIQFLKSIKIYLILKKEQAELILGY